MRLLVRGELLSTLAPELHHGVCHTLPTALVQLWLKLQHCSVEGAIDLPQTVRARVVDPNDLGEIGRPFWIWTIMAHTPDPKDISKT